MEIFIRDLMTRDMVVAYPRTRVLEVVRSMRDQNLPCLVIIEDHKPVGIVTERDLVDTLAKILETDIPLLHTQVDELMSSPPITIKENATLFEALVISRSHKIRHLPVVDSNDEFVGLITQSNLVNAHFHIIERQTEILEKNVQKRTAELTAANQELIALSMTDSLLGIGNRRSMEVDLDHTLASAARYHRPCSLALLDLDYFKKFNDHYGHQAGDEALMQVAKHIEKSMRNTDRLYRYGGEELLLLLTETELNEATHVLNRITRSLEKRAIPHIGSPTNVLTLSAGVVSTTEATLKNSTNKESFIKEADRRLYEAKKQGRNRVVAD